MSTAAVSTGLALARTTIEPRLELRQTWSDRVQGDDGFITTVSPGITLIAEGNRLSGQLEYDYERRFGLGTDIIDEGRHFLLARGTAELVRDFFRVDAGAVITQLVRDFRGPVSLNPDGDNENFGDVYNFYVAPVITQRVGDIGDLLASYRFSYNDVSERGTVFRAGEQPGDDEAFTLGTVSDSYVHSGTLQLSNQTRADRLRWTASTNYALEKLEDLDEEFETLNAIFDVEYALNRTWSLLGSVGWEDIKNSRDNILIDPLTGRPVLDGDGRFQLDPNEPRVTVYDEDGFIWDAGFRFSPTPRFDLVARGGERYGDVVWSGTLNYRPKPGIQLTASYAESIDTFGRLLTQDLNGLPNSFIVSDNFRTGVFPVLSIVGGAPSVSFQSINNATFASKRASLGLNIDRRRHRIALNGFYQTRDIVSFVPLEDPNAVTPTNLDDSDRSYGGLLDGIYRLSQTQQIEYSAFYSNLRFQLTRDRTDDFYGGSLGYRQQLGRNLEVFGRGFIARRDSNTDLGFDDDEVSVTIGLKAVF